MADGVFALVDLGRAVAARLTLDSTLSLNQTTIAVHGEQRTAVATGVLWHDMTLYVVEEKSESSEYELMPNPYAKFGSIHPSVPAFMRLLDDFAEFASRPAAATRRPSPTASQRSASCRPSATKSPLRAARRSPS